jgi:hypothetical protein
VFNMVWANAAPNPMLCLAEYCTHVQAMSLPACLAGTDVLAKVSAAVRATYMYAVLDLKHMPYIW